MFQTKEIRLYYRTAALALTRLNELFLDTEKVTDYRFLWFSQQPLWCCSKHMISHQLAKQTWYRIRIINNHTEIRSEIQTEISAKNNEDSG